MPTNIKNVARPRTSQCRFADGRGRCRRVATIDDRFCRQHARIVEQSMMQESGGAASDLIEGLIAGDRKQAAAGLAGILGSLFRGAGAPPPVARPRPGQPGFGRAQPPPPPRSRPAPTQPPADKAARAALGFSPDEPMTIEKVRTRRKRLAQVFHPDGGEGNVAKMAEINAAAEVLLAAMRPA